MTTDANATSQHPPPLRLFAAARNGGRLASVAVIASFNCPVYPAERITCSQVTGLDSNAYKTTI